MMVYSHVLVSIFHIYNDDNKDNDINDDGKHDDYNNNDDSNMMILTR